MKTNDERTSEEQTAALFDSAADSTIIKLASFPKYASKQSLTRFLAFNELFKIILNVEGAIIECGVFRGSGLMSWAKLSAIFEPANWKRQIIGFDTFEGFPHTAQNDNGTRPDLVHEGIMRSDSYAELSGLIALYDKNRYLGHMPKVQLVKGDVLTTIPKFLVDNPHTIVSLLFLDFDLYSPTKAAIEALWCRMPIGAVIAFDDLNHPYWPGETLAVDESIGIGHLKIRRFSWDSTICYAVKEQ